MLSKCGVDEGRRLLNETNLEAARELFDILLKIDKRFAYLVKQQPFVHFLLSRLSQNCGMTIDNKMPDKMSLLKTAIALNPLLAQQIQTWILSDPTWVDDYAFAWKLMAQAAEKPLLPFLIALSKKKSLSSFLNDDGDTPLIRTIKQKDFVTAVILIYLGGVKPSSRPDRSPELDCAVKAMDSIKLVDTESLELCKLLIQEINSALWSNCEVE